MHTQEIGAEGVAVQLSVTELRLIALVLIETRTGPNAFSPSDWDMLIGMPAELADTLKDQILDVLRRHDS